MRRVTVTTLRKQDIEEHLKLMRTVFGERSRVDLMVKKLIAHHPLLTLNDFFVAKSEGEIVAALNLLPLEWEIEDVPIKVAELACVATHPDFRHMGIQRLLMKEYDARVSTHGYDLSAIEGIPYYYRQFGYEYALQLDEETKICLDQIPELTSEHEIRSFQRSDLPQAKKLLEESKRKFMVHSIRDESIWKMQQETGMIAEREYEAYVMEEKGKIVAYFRFFDDRETKELILKEVTDVKYEQARSILAFLRAECVKRDLKTLKALVSGHEYFAELLSSLGGIAFPAYAWQLHIVDHVRLLEKMSPLFERRLANSIYGDFTGNVNLNFYRNTAQLVFRDGRLEKVLRLGTCDDRSIRINPEVFTKLLFGYKTREQLEAMYPDFLIRASHKRLIDAMFPNNPSFIHTEY